MLEVRIAVIFLAGREFLGCSVLFLDLVHGVFICESLLSYRFIIFGLFCMYVNAAIKGQKAMCYFEF